MKIKKYLSIGLSMLTIMAMVGCAPTESKKEINPENEVSQQTEGEKESTENDNAEKIQYFGKVKNIVGNEIEIDLAKNQDITSDGNSGNTSSEGATESGDSAKEAPVSGSTGVEEGAAEEFDINDIPDGWDVEVREESDEIELEYTGETVKVTIPAGAEVFDMRSLEESKMGAIKKSSVIRVFADGSKDSPVVSRVEIAG